MEITRLPFAERKHATRVSRRGIFTNQSRELVVRSSSGTQQKTASPLISDDNALIREIHEPADARISSRKHKGLETGTSAISLYV